jgi:hypothetical protein
MKAILIDPFEKSIIGILTDGSLQEIYEFIGCDCIDTACPFDTRNEVVFVGDNSALQDPPLPRFYVPGYDWPLYGRAMVFGRQAGGECVSTELTVEQVRKVVVFAD